MDKPTLLSILSLGFMLMLVIGISPMLKVANATPTYSSNATDWFCYLPTHVPPEPCTNQIYDTFSVFSAANYTGITDGFIITDAFLFISNQITYTTKFITAIITVIGTGTCSSSCYQYAGTTTDVIITEVISPLIFILGVIFCFFFMRIIYFGVLCLASAFIIMGLAYIGIIPSFFNLLIIFIVSLALAKLIMNMISGNG